MTSVPANTFPRLMRRLWKASDEQTRCQRVCDALGEQTPHQQFMTHQGGYWLCGVTGQLQRDAFPQTPADLYDETWQPKLQSPREVDREIAHWKRHLSRYEPYRKTGRLFEVASGQGGLLRAAVELGWDAIGNDISPMVAQHAQRLAGAPFLVGPVEQIELEPGAFDVIILNNIFEHLESPMAVLRQLVAAMRPGGVMFLQTLSSQSLSMWSQGHDWYYFDPGHLYIPSHVSMAHYFKQAGLSVIHRSSHGYRSGAMRKADVRSYLRKRADKIIANVASMTNTGTRVRYELVKNV